MDEVTMVTRKTFVALSAIFTFVQFGGACRGVFIKVANPGASIQIVTP
jgi:hypothetical protein